MLKNKLQLNTDIYSESSIRESCEAYKAYACIKMKKKDKYMELTFDKCKYELGTTMKEFENYLINTENTK